MEMLCVVGRNGNKPLFAGIIFQSQAKDASPRVEGEYHFTKGECTEDETPNQDIVDGHKPRSSPGAGPSLPIHHFINHSTSIPISHSASTRPTPTLPDHSLPLSIGHANTVSTITQSISRLCTKPSYPTLAK